MCCKKRSEIEKGLKEIFDSLIEIGANANTDICVICNKNEVGYHVFSENKALLKEWIDLDSTFISEKLPTAKNHLSEIKQLIKTIK